MTLLVTGAGGQVGQALIRDAERRRIVAMGFDKNELDVTDSDLVRRTIESLTHGTKVVVNLAAYTAVDSAETDPESAFQVNAHGVEVLARVCSGSGIPLIHISTDYVFGTHSGEPLKENDATRPLSVYGETKLLGEQAVRRILQEHIILRTSWVFSSWTRNFVTTLLRLGCHENEIRVVRDEEGCPTGAGQVAKVILDIAEETISPSFSKWGTYHFCGTPSVSRAGFAREIFCRARQFDGLCSAHVTEISTTEHSGGAQRPRWSVLDCEKIERSLGIPSPDWRPYLDLVLRECSEKSTEGGIG